MIKHGVHVIFGILTLSSTSIIGSLPNCETKECINVASQLLNFMDTTADPCDDFYKAACGNYLQNYFYDENKPLDGFKKLRKHMDKIAMKGLIKDFENSNDPSEKYVSFFHKTCKEDTVATYSLAIFSTFIFFHKSDYSLNSILSENVRFRGPTGLFNVGVRIVGPDRKLYLELSPPTLDGFDIDSVIDDYNSVAKQLKWEFPVDHINLDATLVKQFSEKLVPTAVDIFSKMGESYEVLKIEKLNWDLLWIYPTDELRRKVMFVGLKYFKKLDEILRETDDKTIMYFLELYAFYNLRKEVHRMKEDCDQAIIDNFPGVLGMAYIRKFFKDDNLNVSTSITNSLLDSMKILIETSKLNNTTEYFERMDHMKIDFGYPDKGSLDYSEKMNGSFVNLVYNLKYNQTVSMLDYVKKDKQPLFYQPIHLAETFYSSSMNVLTVSSLIMQSPFMDSMYLNQYNFASFGSIVASELAKIVTRNRKDNGGSFVDPWDLLSTFDNVSHSELETCFRKSYDMWTFDHVWNKPPRRALHSAEIMINEHIGFLIAYHAYKASEEEPKIRIPGTDHLTPDQIFFYRYAQRSCVPTPSERSAEKIKVLEARMKFPRNLVNGVLMNSDSFSEAFKCKKETRMNPIDKCPSSSFEYLLLR